MSPLAGHPTLTGYGDRVRASPTAPSVEDRLNVPGVADVIGNVTTGSRPAAGTMGGIATTMWAMVIRIGTRHRAFAASLAVLTLAASPLAAAAEQFGAWGTPVSVEAQAGASSSLNTSFNDGCPIESPDGLRLYQATNRPGGLGGIDIWVASRPSTEVGFGAPVRLPAPINSAYDDFCPTPVPGRGLFFVSARPVAGACGGADIYFARYNPRKGWTTPRNLGCQVNGAGGEAGPSYFEADGVGQLYFSSGPDIYVSTRQADGTFGARVAVAELNSTSADLRPNVRKDGLEIVFDSDRSGTIGMADLWFATRASATDAWSAPVNAGSTINSAVNETRGSFSRDGLRLYFGRGPGPEGGSDIQVASRTRPAGD